MKATKQGTTQGRKRSAERQPSAVPAKARSRRSGARDGKDVARVEGAKAQAVKSVPPPPAAPKADGRTAKGDGASTRTAAKPKAARSAKVVRNGVKSASPRQRHTAAGAEAAQRRTRRDKANAAAAETKPALGVAEAAVAPTTSSLAPAAVDPTTESAPAAVAPMTGLAPEMPETAVGDAAEAPPSVDTFASPSASISDSTLSSVAPAPRPLGRRLLDSALRTPLALLRNAGESVVKVRDAYKKSFLPSPVKASGLLAQLSRRLLQSAR